MTTPQDIGALPVDGKAKDSEALEGHLPSTQVVPDTVPVRDPNGDIFARMFNTTHPSVNTAPLPTASLAFRVDSVSDSYIRFLSLTGVRDWLGRVKDSEQLEGKTLDTIKRETRRGFVQDTLKINGKPLDTDINLTADDVGLGELPNYAATSSYKGTSINLLATQKAVYDAAAAPLLEADRKRKITTGTVAPADGEDGDIYLQV